MSFFGETRDELDYYYISSLEGRLYESKKKLKEADEKYEAAVVSACWLLANLLKAIKTKAAGNLELLNDVHVKEAEKVVIKFYDKYEVKNEDRV